MGKLIDLRPFQPKRRCFLAFLQNFNSLPLFLLPGDWWSFPKISPAKGNFLLLFSHKGHSVLLYFFLAKCARKSRLFHPIQIFLEHNFFSEPIIRLRRGSCCCQTALSSLVKNWRKGSSKSKTLASWFAWLVEGARGARKLGRRREDEEREEKKCLHSLSPTQASTRAQQTYSHRSELTHEGRKKILVLCTQFFSALLPARAFSRTILRDGFYYELPFFKGALPL